MQTRHPIAAAIITTCILLAAGCAAPNSDTYAATAPDAPPLASPINNSPAPTQSAEQLHVRVDYHNGSFIATDQEGNKLSESRLATETVRDVLQMMNRLDGGTLYFGPGLYEFEPKQEDRQDTYLSGLYGRGWKNAFYVNQSIAISASPSANFTFQTGLEGAPDHGEGGAVRGGLIVFFINAPGADVRISNVSFYGNSRGVNSTYHTLAFTLAYDTFHFEGNKIVDADKALWGDGFRGQEVSKAYVANNTWTLIRPFIALTLHNTLSNGEIRNNHIQGGRIGIFVDSATNVLVTDNIIEDCSQACVLVWDGNIQVDIRNNTLVGRGPTSGYGVDLYINLSVDHHPHLKGLPQKRPSDYNKIINNSIAEVHTGIRIHGHANELFGNSFKNVTIDIEDQGTDTQSR